MTLKFNQHTQIPKAYPYFSFKNKTLHVENISLDYLANNLGTPIYVYSKAALKNNWMTYKSAIKDRNVLICYGMKANSNLAILKEFMRLGSGFDIVSGGELKRALFIGADPKKIVFSGVGKQDWEIEFALNSGIKCFNVESVQELHTLSKIAFAIKKIAPISLRINPDIPVDTHPYISTGLKKNKFGIDINKSIDAYKIAKKLPNLRIIGLDCHIGSQITDTKPYLDMLDIILPLIQELGNHNIFIQTLDLGGGLGICYKEEIDLDPSNLLDQIFKKLSQKRLDYLQVILEPGRSLVGNIGILLTRIQYLKDSISHNFAIVDASMNELLRPALYQAYHHVLNIHIHDDPSYHEYDIVGPVCESADWLAKNRILSIKNGDILAIESVGAYCMAMASNYNSRTRAAEVMVDNDQYYIIKSRENLTDLFKGESTLP